MFLHVLRLNISPLNVVYGHKKQALPRCEKLLLDGYVRDILTSRTALEGLRLSSTANEVHELSDSFNCFFNLELVLGNHTWPFLQDLRLMQFETTEDYLLELFARHAGTLSIIYCMNMKIHPLKESLASLRRKLPGILDLQKTMFLHDFALHDAESWKGDAIVPNGKFWLYDKPLDLRRFRG